MNLTDYLATTGMTEDALAALIGTSQSYINRLKSGDAWPSANVADRILKATKGAVTPNDFLASRQAKRKRAA